MNASIGFEHQPGSPRGYGRTTTGRSDQLLTAGLAVAAAVTGAIGFGELSFVAAALHGTA